MKSAGHASQRQRLRRMIGYVSVQHASTRHMSGQLTILVVDDEAPIRRVIRHALTPVALLGDDARDALVRVVEAATARDGIDMAAAEQPALIILDLGLPDKPGIDVCREVRRWSDAPIIVLSARHQDTEKAALLDAGADDYVTKPFSTVEFVARARAQLRRVRTASPSASATVQFGPWTVDLQLRRVERDGHALKLTPTEFALLRALVSHPRQTLTHRQLFAAVWGSAEGDAQQYLRVYVGQLRRKLEVDPVRPQFIHTEAGVGYRFEVDEPTPA